MISKFTETAPASITKMAGEPELTGMAKHFNAVTFTGRANVAKVCGWDTLPAKMSNTCFKLQKSAKKYFGVTPFPSQKKISFQCCNQLCTPLMFQATYAAIILTVVAVKAKNKMQGK